MLKVDYGYCTEKKEVFPSRVSKTVGCAATIFLNLILITTNKELNGCRTIPVSLISG